MQHVIYFRKPVSYTMLQKSLQPNNLQLLEHLKWVVLCEKNLRVLLYVVLVFGQKDGECLSN